MGSQIFEIHFYELGITELESSVSRRDLGTADIQLNMK